MKKKQNSEGFAKQDFSLSLAAIEFKITEEEEEEEEEIGIQYNNLTRNNWIRILVFKYSQTNYHTKKTYQIIINYLILIFYFER